MTAYTLKTNYTESLIKMFYVSKRKCHVKRLFFLALHSGAKVHWFEAQCFLTVTQCISTVAFYSVFNQKSSFSCGYKGFILVNSNHIEAFHIRARLLERNVWSPVMLFVCMIFHDLWRPGKEPEGGRYKSFPIVLQNHPGKRQGAFFGYFLSGGRFGGAPVRW